MAAAVYHSERGMLQLLRPAVLKIHPSLPQPKFLPPMTYKERLWYSGWDNRGYLHPEVRKRLQQADPAFTERYLLVDPVQPIRRAVETFNFGNIPAELRQQQQ